MKISLLAAFLILFANLYAQTDTIRKGNVTIIAKKINGDVVMGNKTVNKYYLNKPEIKIYVNRLKRGLYLMRDTVWTESNLVFTRIILGDIEGRQLLNPNFKISIVGLPDTVFTTYYSTTGITSVAVDTKTVLSKDKREYSYSSVELSTNNYVVVTVVSKKPVNVELKL